jgi:hypothetical protein
MDPDKLERLATLLDGFDDEAAAEARQAAHDLRAANDLLNKLIAERTTCE